MSEISLSRKAVLKRFVIHLKRRLLFIKELAQIGGWCGELVFGESLPGGKHQAHRCYGRIGPDGCYSCKSTGIYCKGGCDSWSCRGDYYIV